MRRTRTIATIAILGTLGVAGYAKTANAQTEYSMFLLDRTGSMSTVTNATSVPPTTRWTDAIDAANSVIQFLDMQDVSVDRAYAIWDFRLGAGTTNGDPNQANAVQVWPTTMGDCTGFGTFITRSTSVPGVTNNFCDFGGGARATSTPYSNLIALLGTYKTALNRMPDPNGNGRTPLADSLCRLLDQMVQTDTNAKQTITFESDGLENQSSASGPCGSFLVDSTATAFVNDPNFIWQKTVLDWGMTGTGADVLPGGSWEARIVRRSLRLLTASAATAVTNIPLKNSPIETATTDIAWRVQVHYTTFKNTTTPQLSLSASSPSLITIGGASSGNDISTTQRFAVSALVAGTAAPGTAAAASTVTLSIPQAELSLYKQLGSPSFPSKGTGASRSLFQAITIQPGQTFGTNHVVPGDVDDSGCTDKADYSIMKQRDVWRQRAVSPLQIAIRADLNKDGWVNDADLTILLANWGKGCINPVGPKPTN